MAIGKARETTFFHWNTDFFYFRGKFQTYKKVFFSECYPSAEGLGQLLSLLLNNPYNICLIQATSVYRILILS